MISFIQLYSLFFSTAFAEIRKGIIMSKKTALRLVGALCALTLAMCMLASCSGVKKTKDGRLDYFNSKMEKLVDIPEDSYKSMTATLSESYMITDETVDEYIKNLLFAKKEEQNDGNKVTDEPIKYGDTAYIFYEGFIDGVAFDGGSNMDSAPSTPYALSIGSGSFIDNFEEQLIGVIPSRTDSNNKITVTATFPEVYSSAPELAGKTATFKVYVVCSVQYNVPELNEKTVKNILGFTPSDTDESDAVTQYKAWMKQNLEDANEEVLRTAAVNNLLEQLINSATFKEIPQCELDYYKSLYISEYNSMWQTYTQQGYTFDGFDDFMCQALGLEDGADWESNIALTYTAIIKKHMICHAIAQIEDIQITDDDYEKEIQFYIDSAKLTDSSSTLTRSDVVETVGSFAIRDNALYSRVCSWLYDNSEINYVS